MFVKDEIGERQFYLTPAHPCSYLPGREARTLFLDPRDTIDQTLYQGLTEHGFRRSGGHLYRPHCQGCQACVPTRIPVAGFQPRRNQRRVIAGNRDLTVRAEPAIFNRRYYDLYSRYIQGSHQDGDMYPPSVDQFRSFLLSQWSNSIFLCSYLEEELVAVAAGIEQGDLVILSDLPLVDADLPLVSQGMPLRHTLVDNPVKPRSDADVDYPADLFDDTAEQPAASSEQETAP